MKRIICVILALMAGMANASLVDLRIYHASTSKEAWPATVQDLSTVGALKGNDVVVDNVLNLQCANQSWAEVCKDRQALNQRLKDRNPKLRAELLPKEAFQRLGQEGINLPMPEGFVKVAFAQPSATNVQPVQPVAPATVPAASAPKLQTASFQVEQALKALDEQSSEARTKALAALDAARKAGADGREARSIAGDAKSLAGNANTAAATASARAASAAELALGGAEMARQAKVKAFEASASSAQAVKATAKLSGEMKPWLIVLSVVAALSIIALIGVGVWNWRQKQDMNELAGLPDRIHQEVDDKLVGLREQFSEEVRQKMQEAKSQSAEALQQVGVMQRSMVGYERTAAVLGSRIDLHEEKLKGTTGWVVLPSNLTTEVVLLTAGQTYRPLVQVTGADGQPQMYWIEITKHPEKGEGWLEVKGIDRSSEVKVRNLVALLHRSGGFGGGTNHYQNLDVPDQEEVHASGFIQLEIVPSGDVATALDASANDAASLDLPVAPSPSEDVLGRSTVVEKAGTMAGQAALRKSRTPIYPESPETIATVTGFAGETHASSVAMPSGRRIDLSRTGTR